jgi:GT2 family glycosyltransferase
MTDKRTAKVCVVTINWNGLDDTLECLRSLETINYRDYEVVVIDNGSKNGDADRIAHRFPDVQLIRNPENRGFTGGCNQGIDVALASSAEYVLLLNNDTIVTADFLTKLVERYESLPDAGMISPVILYSDRRRIWFAGAEVRYGIARHLHKGRLYESIDLGSQPFKTEYVPGTALLVSTALIRRIGVLNDDYFAYYEDLDWCYRARKAGRYSYVEPRAIIYHKKSGSTGEGGHVRLNKVPAYFVARNGVLFASNLEGRERMIYVINQFLLKLPLSLMLLVKPQAWGSYVRGLLDGMFSKKTRTIPRRLQL